MLIESLNERYDALDIPMGGTLIRNQPDPVQIRKGLQRVWHFSRNADAALVCDVDHEDDIRRFLGIREGFQPYGEKARIEAEEHYGWREFVPVVAPGAAEEGQPPVIDEFVDDDEDVPDDDLPDLENSDPLADIADLPAADADGETWLRYAASLPGVDDPKDKDQLETYARDNYGVDLDKRLGILKLIKQIANLQRDSE